MAFVGHLIVRLVQVTIGIALAAFAAALFLSIGYVREVAGPMFLDITGERGDAALVPVLALIGAPFVLAAMLAPAAVAVAFGEAMRWRGLIANLLLGALVALYAGWRHFGADGRFDPSRGAIIVLLATGFIAGFAYWLIAGRSAGRWLEPPGKKAG